MLEALFIVESFLCFDYTKKSIDMIKVLKKIKLDNQPLKSIAYMTLLKGVYHFIVCLILWLTFRIKYQ